MYRKTITYTNSWILACFVLIVGTAIYDNDDGDDGGGIL